MKPDLVMKVRRRIDWHTFVCFKLINDFGRGQSLIPVVMAGIIAVYGKRRSPPPPQTSCSTDVVAGLVVAVLIVGSMDPAKPYSLFTCVLSSHPIRRLGLLTDANFHTSYSGFIHLAAGTACGMTGMAAGHAIGIIGDAVRPPNFDQPVHQRGPSHVCRYVQCARAFVFQQRIFVSMVLMLIFAEVIGLYGLIVALIAQVRRLCSQSYSYGAYWWRDSRGRTIRVRGCLVDR